MNELQGPGEATIKGRVNLNDLRLSRTRPFHPTSIRAELYAKEYASWPSWPNDGFADHVIESIEDTRAVFRSLVRSANGAASTGRRALRIDFVPKLFYPR